MEWSGAFAILFGFVGIALVFHGFPNFHIGTKHEHWHYDDDRRDEEC